MKMNYDPKADALYIKLRDASIEESDEVSEGIIVDYDDKGKAVGIEFLDAALLFGGRHEMRVEMALTEELRV
ncbi:MAG: DUF2283 domain-containing protein [Candidatus Omnitrophica bacterium]|nr:DUF2283 domain-containing protein [Candidatus Omnitrophota bacterium]MBU0896856.1 DUF2283 domain-containing protein [Candidatus Omnitrophota bacterium]MBU1366732.1 DUF2283 domain-containing protein [Candidatus Omnitrophota bacterium]MBU1524735.1 DUF2283 domain-containing protein [Candidatus Omnitrophota bacterium]MBU1810154.1 DUF2283 domain-containing protein [Candidatus Omnitrophota bacterium]